MRFLSILCLLWCFGAFAQDATLANEYFKNGEYEKALTIYQKLYKNNKRNKSAAINVVKTQQQLEQYDDAELLLTEAIQSNPYPPLLIELGYNYALKNDTINARKYYNDALEGVKTKPNYAQTIGYAFQKHGMLDEAIQAYKLGMEYKPTYNFNSQLAKLYGEKGDINKMFTSYIDYLELNTKQINTVKRAFNDFISEDKTNENNKLLRTLLLKKIQSNPNVLWNEMLSWLFIQQKEYNKAFVQEKAIYKRELTSLYRIEELALIALGDNKKEDALDIFNFIIETSPFEDDKLNAHLHVLHLEMDTANPKDYSKILDRFETLFSTYGKTSESISLQIAYAHFLAFYNNQSELATEVLKEALKLNIDEFKQAEVKLELGDVLVLQEKFNEALIYYTQIQRSLKNSTISQEARFKVAKTSYYKGDFKWAESQLKILKKSTTQLTANDALDLKLLISDNKAGDSLQTALTQYAKADLYTFQNKKTEAITLLNNIITQYKTEPIVAQSLLKQALLYIERKDYKKAEHNLETLVADFKEGILIDDALFLLADLNENHLENSEKAKTLFETIIFNHADSIYFVDARKRFRALRGDTIN